VSAAYPASLLNWTQRLNSQTVQAADPNTLAAEIDAVEQFVGTNPHIESSALTGATKTFTNLSARVSATMLQSGHPYIELGQSAEKVYHSTNGTHVQKNTYNVTSSWPNYISAGNIVIKDAGIWIVNANQVWDSAAAGWVMHILYAGSAQLRRSIFSYDQFPKGGSNSYGERFINQYGMTETTYVGRLSAGTVISVSSGNYTNRNPLLIESMSLSAYFLRP
jgi:hypothetical protein